MKSEKKGFVNRLAKTYSTLHLLRDLLLWPKLNGSDAASQCLWDK